MQQWPLQNEKVSRQMFVPFWIGNGIGYLCKCQILASTEERGHVVEQRFELLLDGGDGIFHQSLLCFYAFCTSDLPQERINFGIERIREEVDASSEKWGRWAGVCWREKR